jgi:hypothetical protein
LGLSTSVLSLKQDELLTERNKADDKYKNLFIV